MSVIRTVSATPLEQVSIENTDGPSVHVWLRRNIAKDAADNGPDGKAYEFYTADELHFMADGAPSVDELTERFDELWAEHEDDGMTTSDRLAALSVSESDSADALAELGDMVAEQADALAELGDIVSTLQGGE